MASSDLKSFYFQKKQRERGTIGNSSTIALLTLQGLSDGKKRLQDDPVKLQSLISLGILRDTIQKLPIGLSLDNRLYMPLYNSSLEVGGIFFFDEKFKTWAFEYTWASPNYVLGNPFTTYNAEKPEEILICSSVLEVIYAYQLGFDNPIYIPDEDNFPHAVFGYFKKISLLHPNESLMDIIGKEWIACYHLERELEPEDRMDTIAPMKQWLHYGGAVYTHTSNPFTFIDKLWWNVQSPVSKKKYLINSDYNVYELTQKNSSKSFILQASTEFGEIRLSGDPIFAVIWDQKVTAPTTLEVVELLTHSMTNLFPTLRTDYIEVIVLWIMYSYVYPKFPWAPQNLVINFENNSLKLQFHWYMERFFLPWSQSLYRSRSVAWSVILKIDRSSLPLEDCYAPKLMCASLKDWWFDLPPSLVIGEATGQHQDLRWQSFVNLKQIRSTLLRWSLGFITPAPHTIQIPKGLSGLCFLYTAEGSNRQIDRINDTIFVETQRFITKYIKNKKTLPKGLDKDTRTLSFNSSKWKRPHSNEQSKKRSSPTLDESESSVSESIPE